jgi:hypothetical protein
LGVLLGNGDGSFQTAKSITAFGPAFYSGGRTALADFNGDGKLDVATGELGALFLGNGDGTFQPALALGALGVSTAVGDFNADGKPDLAVANGGNWGLTVLLDIGPVATTTSLTSTPNPSVQGKPVTFTATVSSLVGTPTGKVEFLNGSAVLATYRLTSGSAKYTTSNLPPGSDSITAVYLGNANNNTSKSSPVNQDVLTATTTTLTSSPNPSVFGQEIVFAAAVTSNTGTPPDGEKVTFKLGSTILGTAILSSGSAKFSSSTLGVGTKRITAVYGGDANFAPSTSNSVTQAVTKATSETTLTATPDPSKYRQPATFTARVSPQSSGTPTGTVTFRDRSTTLGTVKLDGCTASYTTSKLIRGTHTIKATYNGNVDFGSSSASIQQKVE